MEAIIKRAGNGFQAHVKIMAKRDMAATGKEISLQTTGNGYQWWCSEYTREEAQAVIDALTEMLGKK